jgi:hypothetical protein
MDVVQDQAKDTIVLGQRKYMEDVLSRFNMSNANGRTVPACANAVLKADGDPLDSDEFDCAGAVGCLQYQSKISREEQPGA